MEREGQRRYERYVEKSNEPQHRLGGLLYVAAAITFSGFVASHSVFRFLGVSNGEAHLSSAQQASHPDARFSRAHGDEVGARSSQPPPKEGPEAADG